MEKRSWSKNYFRWYHLQMGLRLNDFFYCPINGTSNGTAEKKRKKTILIRHQTIIAIINAVLFITFLSDIADIYYLFHLKALLWFIQFGCYYIKIITYIRCIIYDNVLKKLLGLRLSLRVKLAFQASHSNSIYFFTIIMKISTREIFKTSLPPASLFITMQKSSHGM